MSTSSPRSDFEERPLPQVREARKTPLWPSHQKRWAYTRMRSTSDRYAPRAVNHAIRRACQKAGVKLFSPDQLRHLCADEVELAHSRCDRRAQRTVPSTLMSPRQRLRLNWQSYSATALHLLRLLLASSVNDTPSAPFASFSTTSLALAVPSHSNTSRARRDCAA